MVCYILLYVQLSGPDARGWKSPFTWASVVFTVSQREALHGWKTLPTDKLALCKTSEEQAIDKGNSHQCFKALLDKAFI